MLTKSRFWRGLVFKAMFIDDVTIKIKAGQGGEGEVAFNKTKMNLGPTGADGGKGGSVYFEGVSDLNALIQFRFRKDLAAEDGKRGKTKLNDGSDGPDLVLKIPIGTVVHNLSTGQDFEIVTIGQKVLVAKGGKGGQGNFKFRSSVNTTPFEFQEGYPGEGCELRLELKLIADVGLIGLPNVGKSSLLNELTRARSQVANYPFTTLAPNLGVYYDLILADLPGLIEGASEGKGLGIKFLKHVERTKILFHLVSADSFDPVADYQTVRAEMGAYNKELLKKPEYLFVSKKDAVSESVIDAVVKNLGRFNKNVMSISIFDWDSIEAVKKILNHLILEKTKP